MLNPVATSQGYWASRLPKDSYVWLAFRPDASRRIDPIMRESIENRAHVARCDAAIAPGLRQTVYSKSRPMQMGET